MNKGITNVMIFSIGAVTGAYVTWRVLDTKYKQRTQEEVDSVKSVFTKRYGDVEDRKEEPNENFDKSTVNEYTEVLKKNEYVNYSELASVSEKESDEMSDQPYVISPEDFGEIEDYETLSLTYYSDGVLADDNNRVIDDVDDVVGLESLETFGEFEDDSVFVRNEKTKCDYEILLDHRNYLDLVRKPHEVID